MPFAAVGGSIAASVAGAAVSSALAPSPSGGSGGGGGYYVPTGLQPADQQWQGIQNQNYNKYMGYDLDQYGLNSLQTGINNAQAYGGGYQNAANAAGQYYGQLGSQLQGASGNLFNAGNQVYQSAFDPQNALYNRTVQQLQDQTGATNSMYGLGSSGAGAGVANQALGNFNIDWQNQQLQRQVQGLGALGQGYGQAGALGQMGAGSTLMSGQLPYETGQTLAAAPGQIAGQFGQFLNQNVYGPGQAIQNQYIPYANQGQGAQAIPYQNQYNQAQAAGGAAYSGINQAAQGLGNAYQNAGSWGNLFGGTTGSYGSGDFSGAFTSNPYYSGGGNSYGFTM